MTPERTRMSQSSNSSGSQKQARTPLSQTAPASSHHPESPGRLVQRIRQQGRAALSDNIIGQARHLAGQWVPEISRHGLTSATVVRDLGNANSHNTNSNKNNNQTVATPSPITHAGSGTSRQPLHHGRSSSARSRGLQAKRPSEEGGSSSWSPSSPLKRPRIAPPSFISLSSIPQGPQKTSEPLTSPMFFSNSSRPALARPPSFSVSEATATMIGRMHEDQEKITRQWLPKGNVHSASPARSNSTSGSWPFDPATSPEARAIPAHLKPLQEIGIVELLEQDDRPTFVIDLLNPTNTQSVRFDALFQNASIRASESLQALLAPDSSDAAAAADFANFKFWVMSFAGRRHESPSDAPLSSWSYGGINWTCATIRRRYRVVSGNAAVVAITPRSPSPLAPPSSILEQRARGPTPSRDVRSPRDRASSDADYFGHVEEPDRPPRSRSVPRDVSDIEMQTPLAPAGALQTTAESMQSFDWTRIADSPALPKHIRFARSVDWASTPLGPLETWEPVLRIMSNMIMGSPHPAAMYWGSDYTTIYNEAYITLAGQKHPRLMGMPYKDGWPELWDDIAPVFQSAWDSGQATMKHDDQVFMVRNGFLEETYFSWSIVPLLGADGKVVALFNPAFENTRRALNERRMLTLREVGEKTSQAQNVKSFWAQVLQGLEYNEWDIPFALVYSVNEDSESEVSSMHSGSLLNPPHIVLEGSLGVPANHPCAVQSIDLRTSEEGFAPYMRDSISAATNSPVVLSQDAGTLPHTLLDGLKLRGFGDPCRTVVVFPVHPTTAGDAVVGFLVMGINPRRPYDEDYQLFVHLLSRQLATSTASVVLFEEEIRRGQRAARMAALDRQELSQQLYARTQEAVESEWKFTRMAEFAPVGMFIADHNGTINYSNERWWELSRHRRAVNTLSTWMESVHDEDRAALNSAWTDLVSNKVAITQEIRFKWSRLRDGRQAATWALLSAFPEKDEAGNLKRIFGCITDISRQKWAEGFEKQRREEAVELKRQQENFIDITSHEMRNPLSAVLQSSDEITNALLDYEAKAATSGLPPELSTLLRNCLEASNTISLCASHQKRIVDDILTLSKLDSQLLLVTPVDVQPVQVIRDVMKMFAAELGANDILGEFRVDRSYLDLGIDWVKLDPSRLRQVLINLMTNAIKFTTSREKKSITIRLAASIDGQPYKSGLSYFPSRSPDREHLTDEPGWGNGQKIDLHISVADTGPGLDDQEKNMLFQRFSQTSPRTHVRYGGSGLGLFISRILSELQGGQIGVKSKKGTGSIFSFYVKARVVHPMQLSPSTTMMDLTQMAPLQVPSDTSSVVAYATNSSKTSALIAPTIAPQISPRQSISIGGDEAARQLDVLIVEDNIVNQKVLRKQLRNFSKNTYVANHGGEALEALQRSQVWSSDVQGEPRIPALVSTTSHGSSVSGSCDSARDSQTQGSEVAQTNININVILMDLEMPVMDGMTCARKIRELEKEGTINRHVPIIAVTAYARPEQIASAKAAGIDDVISKPFRMVELIPKIEELVAKYDGLGISAPPEITMGSNASQACASAA